MVAPFDLKYMITLLIQEQLSPKYAINKRFQLLTFWAIVGLIVVPLLQYLPLHIDILLSGKVRHWNLSDGQYKSVGKMRYIKDLYLLGFSILWPLLLLKVADNRLIQWMLAVIGIEMAIIGLGLVGHIKEPVPILIAAGLRWLLLLHGAVGVVFLIVGYRLFQSKDFMRRFEWLTRAIIIFNFVLVFLQWWQVGFRSVLGLRLAGVFVSAGDLAFYGVGICLVLLVLPMSRHWKNSLFLLLFATVILSGTRSAMIIVMFIWMASLLISFGRSSKLFWLASPLLMLIFFGTVQLAQHLANRGTLIEGNIEKGRLQTLISLSKTISESPLFDTFFGKGLGYGTNTAFILQNRFQLTVLSAQHSWQTLTDNTFAGFFLQMGLVGIVTLLLSFFVLGYFSLRSSRREPKKLVALYLIFFVLSIEVITGNIFNQFGFMILLGVVMGFMLSKDGQNQKASVFSSH